MTPFLRIVSNHMRIANEPKGKKCGPRLFPITFEKIRLVNVCALIPAVTVACFIDSSPRMVMGQLFMKLAPTVTIKLGRSVEKIDGRERALALQGLCGLDLGWQRSCCLHSGVSRFSGQTRLAKKLEHYGMSSQL